MTSDDKLDEMRARVRAFERHERIERLGWVLAAVFAAGFVLIFVVISPWRWWLILAIAVWCLVGFLLAGTEDQSLGHRLLFAPLAPLALLFFAPLLLPGKDAWTERRIKTQLERIAVEDVRVAAVVDGNLGIGDNRPGEANFGWWGDAKVALRRLRVLPDNAGRDAFWIAFPEKTHSVMRDLAVELERICGDRTFPVVYLGVPGRNGALRITDRTVFEDTPSPEFEWEWEGTPDEAVERLRLVPDGAGRDGIWGAFPDKVWPMSRPAI